MEEIIKKYYEYEEKNKLNERFLEWTFLRAKILVYLTRPEIYSINKNYKKKYRISIASKIARKFNKIIFSKINNIYIKIKIFIILFFAKSFYRKLESNDKSFLFIPFYRKEPGYYPCKFTYKYYEIMNDKALIFKESSSIKISDLLKSKNSFLFYEYLINRDIYYKNTNYDGDVLSFIDKFFLDNNIHNEEYIFFRKKLLKMLFDFNNLKNKYNTIEEILKKINVKIIFEVDCSRAINQIINYKTYNTEIKTVELEHGQIGAAHYSYYFFEKKIPAFAKYLFCFGDEWKKNLLKSKNDQKVISMGFPFFTEKYMKYIEKNKSINKNIILFLSQRPIGERLSKLALKLSKKLDNSFEIIYKLHPGEYPYWKNEYSYLIDSNVNVIDNNENDLYYYLEKSKLQIGVYSTAIFEGYGFNIPTLLFDVDNYLNWYMSSLFDRSNVKIIKNYNDLEDIIQTFLEKEPSSNNEYSDLWEIKNDADIKEVLNSLYN